MKTMYVVTAIAIVSALIIGAARGLTRGQNMSDSIASWPMKTVCVGRFTIDVPEKAIVTYRPAMIAGWEVVAHPKSEEDFLLHMQQKQALLTSRKNERDGISLESVREIKSDAGKGRIYLYDRKWIGLIKGGKKNISEAVALDGLVWSNGVSYELKAELKLPTDITELEKILLQLVARPVNELPVLEGFCFDHGLIRDPLTVEQHEYVSIFLGLASHPDLAISLSSYAGYRPGKTLLQRVADDPIARQYPMRVHQLRSGARSIGGLAGEESLERVDELNGTKAHGFMWESIVNGNDLYSPNLVLELSTGLGRPGQPVQSSLTDAEAIDLWNKISSGLRRRAVR